MADNTGFVATKSGLVGSTTTNPVPPTTSMTPTMSTTPRNDAFNSYQNTILPPLPNIGPVAPMSRRLT